MVKPVCRHEGISGACPYCDKEDGKSMVDFGKFPPPLPLIWYCKALPLIWYCKDDETGKLFCCTRYPHHGGTHFTWRDGVEMSNWTPFCGDLDERTKYRCNRPFGHEQSHGRIIRNVRASNTTVYDWPQKDKMIVPSPKAQEWCFANDRGFTCTLPRLHSSFDHMAHGSNGNVVHSWKADRPMQIGPSCHLSDDRGLPCTLHINHEGKCSGEGKGIIEIDGRQIPFNEDSLICDDRHQVFGFLFDSGYSCTLPKDHDGDHICQGTTTPIISKWKNKKDKRSMSKPKPYRYPLWLNILRFLTGQPWIKFKALPPVEEEKAPQKLLPPKRDTTTSGPPPGCGPVFDSNGYMNADAISEEMSQIDKCAQILGRNVPSETPKPGDIVLQKEDGSFYFADGIKADMVRKDGGIIYLSEEVRKLEPPKSMQLAPPVGPLTKLFQESVSEAEQARIKKEQEEEVYARSDDFKRDFKASIDRLIDSCNRSLDDTRGLRTYIFDHDITKVAAKKVIAWLNDNGVKSSLYNSIGYSICANRKQFIELMKKTSSNGSL
jgi:hypothetical protein